MSDQDNAHVRFPFKHVPGCQAAVEDRQVTILQAGMIVSEYCAAPTEKY